MEIIVLPFGLILWLLAYETKPIQNDEMSSILEEKNIIKRSRLLNILDNNLWILLLNYKN